MSRQNLRPYQNQALNQFERHFELGGSSTLLVSPTGSGKTRIATAAALVAAKSKHLVVFLVHRETLISQTVESFNRVGERVGVIKSGYKPPTNPESIRIWVVGVQSYRSGSIPWEAHEGALIVYDECHTVRWYKTASRVKDDALSHFSKSRVSELGLTATPWRLNPREYMGQYFDSIIHTVTPRRLIDMGFLVPFRYWGWGGFDRATLKTGDSGDYTLESLKAATLNDSYLDESVEQLFASIEKLSIPNPRFACFCVSHEQSQLLRRRVAARVGGENTGIVLGDTPPTQRDEIYSQFAEGEGPQFLFGCGCFAEGWDCPPCNGVGLFRPTKSKALYVQIVGRAARPYPGKGEAWVLDFSGTVADLGYVEDLCENFGDVLDPPPEPKEREIKDPESKDCPQCQAVVPKAAPVCPHCGYRFVADNPKPDRKPSLPGFGKILSKPNQHALKKLRARRWFLYRDGKDPELFRTWAREFQHEGDLNLEDPALLWGICHSVREDDPKVLTAAYWEFEHYLRQFRTIKPYLDWHLQAEFGGEEPRYSHLLEMEIPAFCPIAPYKAPLQWLNLTEPPMTPEGVLDAAKAALSGAEGEAQQTGVLWALSHLIEVGG